MSQKTGQGVRKLNKIRQIIFNISQFFQSLSNFSTYSESKKELDSSLVKIFEKLSDISADMNNVKEKIENYKTDLDSIHAEIEKVKEGLQIELFGSLQALHTRLTERGWASIEEKQDAKRYYEQIHKLGKDGWSERYYTEILALADDRNSYYKNLK